MNPPRVPLLTILLLSAAAPIWICVTVILSESSPSHPGGRTTTALAVLVGITLAVHRLLKEYPYAWAWSALLAGVIGLGSLSVAYVLAGGFG